MKALMIERRAAVCIVPTSPLWPSRLEKDLNAESPSVLFAVGNIALLNARKTAIFCSAKAPAHVVLRCHDVASRFRDQGMTIISGFHSPLEKDCLRILLRGNQPIIICPARCLQGMRIPGKWRTALDAGRLLLLSSFAPQHRRITTGLAAQRNELVAALADDFYFAHVTPGGQLEALAQKVGWFDRRSNEI